MWGAIGKMIAGELMKYAVQRALKKWLADKDNERQKRQEAGK